MRVRSERARAHVRQELFRKLAFNAFMVFIFPGSKLQLVIGFMVSQLFLLVSPPRKPRPFARCLLRFDARFRSHG